MSASEDTRPGGMRAMFWTWMGIVIVGLTVRPARPAAYVVVGIRRLARLLERTLQNWQSEFLAVGCMVAFAIYVRQRGSAESKPVGTPHHTSSLESE